MNHSGEIGNSGECDLVMAHGYSNIAAMDLLGMIEFGMALPEAKEKTYFRTEALVIQSGR
ncbi:MAG: hypothetical protein ABGY95_10330 [Rubritalea sp.]|uniref:hypothetical protein n=1 Tax=Rubritalea sp. TaxID=2109375 RepID=UPI0032424817